MFGLGRKEATVRPGRTFSLFLLPFHWLSSWLTQVSKTLCFSPWVTKCHGEQRQHWISFIPCDESCEFFHLKIKVKFRSAPNLVGGSFVIMCRDRAGDMPAAFVRALVRLEGGMNCTVLPGQCCWGCCQPVSSLLHSPSTSLPVGGTDGTTRACWLGISECEVVMCGLWKCHSETPYPCFSALLTHVPHHPWSPLGRWALAQEEAGLTQCPQVSCDCGTSPSPNSRLAWAPPYSSTSHPVMQPFEEAPSPRSSICGSDRWCDCGLFNQEPLSFQDTSQYTINPSAGAEKPRSTWNKC